MARADTKIKPKAKARVTDKAQSERFKKTARELGCDESEDALERAFKAATAAWHNTSEKLNRDFQDGCEDNATRFRAVMTMAQRALTAMRRRTFIADDAPAALFLGQRGLCHLI
jgi:hypothetical protein